MEKLRQLWMTEMQAKCSVKHSGITHTKGRGWNGVLLSISFIQRSLSKATSQPALIPASWAQAH